MQDAFEQWAMSPVGPAPLVVKPWHNPQIHFSERVKWLNSDRMREMLMENPALEQLVTMHLQQLQFLMAPPVQIDPKTGQPMQQGPEAGPSQGGGRAMRNSNAESGATKGVPRGNGQAPPNTMGPV